MVLLSDRRFARYTVENFPFPAALPTLYSSSRPIITLCCVVCMSWLLLSLKLKSSVATVFLLAWTEP